MAYDRINKCKIIFLGSTADAISQYSTKKIHIEFTTGKTMTVTDSASAGLVEILAHHKILFTDVKNIKIEEGRLEEAFSRMVNV